MKVKVCGLKNRENIREVVSCKPDFLGFIFYHESIRFVGETFDPRLMRSIPPYINKVGVFVNEDTETIIRLAERFGLNYVQLHGDEETTVTAALKSKRIGVIKAFRINDNFDFTSIEPYLPFCEYFLFDTKTDAYGGSGEKFNWEVLQRYTLTKPFFLGGGINRNDTESVCAFRHPSFFAVDINSGFETGPGIKDVFSVSEFIKAVKKV
jgi:phosphoribosylanthranilate isomerase